MTASGKVAIARFVLRSKEYLVALRPAGDLLELSTMIFADEIADAGALDELAAVQDVEVGERELAMAEQLIGSLTEPFEPGRYRDEYRERVLELIERKAQGEQIEVGPAPEAAAAPVPDLMAALKASLDAAKAQDVKPAPRKRKPAAKPAAARPKAPARGAGKR